MRRLLLVAAMCWPVSAMAAQDQVSVGIEGALALPDFRAGPSTSFTLAAYQVGVGIDYYVLHRLSLGARFTYSQFEGVGDGFSTRVGEQVVVGQGSFDGRFYEPQVTARYEIFGGYEISPYLEASGGYQWAQYLDVDIIDDQDRTLAEDTGDFGQGAFTAEAGLFVDTRFFDFATVGIGVRYKRIFDDLYEAQVSIPLRLSYYWY